jgi:putative phosphoribosyl transferase
VLFAHGSGSSRLSPRNQWVADRLGKAGYATMLLDLLTDDEERRDRETGEWRFDIDLLSSRVLRAIEWLTAQPATADLPLGLFGASTGVAAALTAAAERPERVLAIVSRGGRPDLAGPALARVQAPTLLIVGGNDEVVVELNKQAAVELGPRAEVAVVPDATHLFTEPGALEEVSDLAVAWFNRHLTQAHAAVGRPGKRA